MPQGIIFILVTTLCVIGNSAKRIDPTRFDSGKNPLYVHVQKDPTRFDTGKKTILAPIGRDPTRFDSGKNPLLAPIRRGGSVLGSLVDAQWCEVSCVVFI